MKKRPDDFYAMIADDYEAALDLKEHAGTAIAEAYGVPTTTAYRWIRRSRELGLLAPTVPGGYGGMRKLRAVAKAVDVPPDVLARAIIDHADCDLRISPAAALMKDVS